MTRCVRTTHGDVKNSRVPSKGGPSAKGIAEDFARSGSTDMRSNVSAVLSESVLLCALAFSLDEVCSCGNADRSGLAGHRIVALWCI